MVSAIGLLGAGAHARELAEYAGSRGVAFFAVETAFLDAARPQLIDITTTEDSVLAVPVIAAVGAPAVRKRLVDLWGGDEYAQLIAPSAWVSPSATVAPGAVVMAGATVSQGVYLGKHVVINLGATVSHGCTLGDYVTVSPGVNIAGDTTIGSGVFLGVGASVSNGVTICDGAVVGAGAAVIANVDTPGTYVGVPARKVRDRDGWLNGF
jgi:sugar O-acyltransferase (sialic acid O-acetyltransferase NeuD family)